MKEIEILAPAGHWESLKAAVKNGADAVYFGVGKQNARAGAKNFDLDAARDAIDYCHSYRVNAHITVNTLLLDKELPEVLDLVAELRSFGVDALIVQDLGLASVLRTNFEDLPLHASTQMSIHNSDGAIFAHSLGCERVVLARECSLNDISLIRNELVKKNCPIDLEVFVQGAMCVSVSGQCLHSSFIGRRSGNRGLCAQPCRMDYRIEANGKTSRSGRLLSMRDLSLIDCLAELKSSGVASLKIEGRMKPPSYVAAMVSAYRRAIDDANDAWIKNKRKELEKTYCRSGGFCRGYSEEDLIFEGDPSYNEWPKEEKRQDEIKRRIGIEFYGRLNENSRLKMSLLDGDKLSVDLDGAIPQPAKSSPMDEQKLKAQLSKLGDTPFVLNEIDVNIGENLFLPASDLNDLRRRAAQMLQEKIISKGKRSYKHADITIIERKQKECKQDTNEKGKPMISAQLASLDQAKQAEIAGADEIYIQPRIWNCDELLRISEFALACKRKVFLALPPILMPRMFEKVKQMISAIDSASFSGAVAAHAGQIEFLLDNFKTVHGDYTLNICNADALKKQISFGLKRQTLSVELNSAQYRDLARTEYSTDIIVYGKIPSMQLMHCPVRREKKSCADCESGRRLTDRTDAKFDLMAFNIDGAAPGSKHKDSRLCAWQLLNSQALDLARHCGELRKIQTDAWRLLFYGEKEEQVDERIKAYIALRDGAEFECIENGTGLHFHRGF